MLFQNLIPMIIQKECPSVPYLHGSPFFRDNDEYLKSGGDAQFSGIINETLRI